MTEATPPTRCVVPIVLGLAALLLLAVVLITAARDGAPRADFVCFYANGVIIRQRNAAKLYDPAEQARIERLLLRPAPLLINSQPPFEALWFALLARLSLLPAYVLWGAINVGLWLLFQQLMRGYAPNPRKTNHYIWLCCLFMPLWYALGQGQTSVLLLLAFSLTFISLQRGQDFRAGVFLGLGLLKFAVALPFALICFLLGKWRLVAGFLTAACGLGAVSVLAVGLAGMRSYAHLLIDFMRRPDNPLYASMRSEDRMPSVKGFLATLLTGRLDSVYVNTLVMAASAALVLFTAWRWRQEDRRGGGASSGLMFAAALTVSQLVAPHFYAYDLTLMLLAVLLVIGAPQWSQRSRQRTILMTAMVILYAPPVYLVLLVWRLTFGLAPVLAAFALAAISLARKNGPTREVAEGTARPWTAIKLAGSDE